MTGRPAGTVAAEESPHLLMIVPNGIEGDSRVHKVAATAVRAGYRVSVLGVSRRNRGALAVGGALGGRIRTTPLAAAADVRVALLDEERRTVLLERAEAHLRRLDRAHAEAPDRSRRAERRRAREREELAAEVARLSVPVEVPEAIEVGTEGEVPTGTPERDWRAELPLIADYEDSFVPWVVELAPDLVHVHDAPLLPAAVWAARELERRGRRPRLVYDAHEWWPGLALSRGPYGAAVARVERTYAREADAVVTVGPVLARGLREEHGLAADPVVVENCPEQADRPAPGRAGIRTEVGLADDVPLLVYSGALSEERGVHDVVRALPLVPAAHLVVVCGDPRGDEAVSLAALAAELGVTDRFHLLPYVPPESVTWYLASADVGLAPFRRNPSHDSALATKVSEYQLAGLPLVGSDCTVMAEYLTRTGTGTVFTAGDVEGLATALREVLAEPGRFRAALTPELRAQRTWEAQEPALLALYERLAGPPVVRGAGAAGGVGAEGVGAAPRVVVLGHGGRADPAAAALRAARPDAVVETVRPLRLAGAATYADHPRLARAYAALERTARATAVVSAGLPHVFGTTCGSALDELRLLRELGVPCVVLLEAEQLADRYALAELALAGCVLVAPRPGVVVPGVGELPHVPYAPATVPADPTDPTDPTGPADPGGRAVPDGPLRVVVHTGWGPAAHRVTAVVRRLQAEGADLALTTARVLTPAAVAEADVVVGDLLGGEVTAAMLDAMATGAVVVAHVDPAARAALGDPPVVECTPVTAATVLPELLGDRARVAATSAASVAHVRDRHAPDARDAALVAVVGEVLAAAAR